MPSLVDDLLNNLGQDCESQQTHITGGSLTDDTEVPGTAVVAISHHEGGSFDRQAIIEDAVMTTKAKLFCYFRWNFFGSKQWLRTAKLPKAGADPDLDDFLQSIDSMVDGKKYARRNASLAWLNFRKALGVVLASNVFSSEEKLLSEYRKATADPQNIFFAAVDIMHDPNLMPVASSKMLASLAKFSGSTEIVDASCAVIDKLNKKLAQSLCGASASNVMSAQINSPFGKMAK